MSTMEITEPDEEQNLDIPKLLDLENSSYYAVEIKYCNVKLLGMLEEGLHADVTVNANGGSVKAHKSVLAIVSPVFRAMFKHSMQEQLTSVVNIPNISIQGVELFLALIYVLNDNIDTPYPLEFNKAINEHFDELLEMCCKYDVWKLASTILAANLELHLTPENCWDYFHQFDSMDLSHVDALWDYMFEHYREVIKSERFESEMQTNSEIVHLFLKGL